MRIEKSSLQSNGASPLEKLRRTASSLDGTLDDIDLSFMDLLNSIVSESVVNALTEPTKTGEEEKLKEKAKIQPEASKATTSGKLTLVGKVSATQEDKDESLDSVDHDMMLLKDALTPVDMQYMKQVVIPGLPILMGTVPTNSVFPTGEDGEVSYRGFEISPKLSELIEKGYRTGRPIRVELDQNSSVVLKIKNGQVSAQFVSSDKNASLVLQQGLDELRNRMLARNLPVGQLEYQYKNPNQQQQKDQSEDSQQSTDTES